MESSLRWKLRIHRFYIEHIFYIKNRVRYCTSTATKQKSFYYSIFFIEGGKIQTKSTAKQMRSEEKITLKRIELWIIDDHDDDDAVQALRFVSLLPKCPKEYIWIYMYINTTHHHTYVIHVIIYIYISKMICRQKTENENWMTTGTKWDESGAFEAKNSREQNEKKAVTRKKTGKNRCKTREKERK